MARIVPAEVGDDIPESEAVVRTALGGLSASWTVFHGVCWCSDSGLARESDFVLLHPRWGLVVLEVKGSLVQVREGVFEQWRGKADGWQRIDPIRQAHDGQHHFGRQVQALVGRRVPHRHGVVVPFTPSLEHPGLPPGSLWGSAELSEPAQALNRLIDGQKFGHVALSPAEVEAIVDRLAPDSTPGTTPDAPQIDTQRSTVALLVDRQAEALDQTRAELASLRSRLDHLAATNQGPELDAVCDRLSTVEGQVRTVGGAWHEQVAHLRNELRHLGEEIGGNQPEPSPELVDRLASMETELAAFSSLRQHEQSELRAQIAAPGVSDRRLHARRAFGGVRREAG